MSVDVVSAIQSTAQAASYDRITLLLTIAALIVAAAGLVLVVFTVLVAILGYYGKKELIAAAEKKAEAVAREWVEKNATPEALYGQYTGQNDPFNFSNIPVASGEISAPKGGSR